MARVRPSSTSGGNDGPRVTACAAPKARHVPAEALWAFPMYIQGLAESTECLRLVVGERSLFQFISGEDTGL